MAMAKTEGGAGVVATQFVTQHAWARRAAKHKVVEMVRSEKPKLEAKKMAGLLPKRLCGETWGISGKPLILFGVPDGI
jgi:hypothetical protein